jgi:hypothetical protein
VNIKKTRKIIEIILNGFKVTFNKDETNNINPTKPYENKI